MADQDFPAFQQFMKTRSAAQGEMPINNRTPQSLTVRTVGDSDEKTWVYLAHDALGILVREPLKPADSGSFLPWSTIVSIK